jgi:mannose-1-phosphate guanylyltransferase
MRHTIIPVLLAGGVGERFWPLSRARRPKQLLPLLGRRTMLEETLARIRPLCRGRVRPLIVTSAAIAAPIRAVLRERCRCDLVAEPMGRNTAPAVALAAAWVERRYGPSIMAVLTADHAISPPARFVRCLRYAASVAARHDRLVVFGIPPSRPDSGYGYVEVGRELDRHGRDRAYAARRFVEKPDRKTAVRYCRSGRYLWNSGMFVWRTGVVLDEFRRYTPALYRQVRAAARAGFTPACGSRSTTQSWSAPGAWLWSAAVSCGTMWGRGMRWRGCGRATPGARRR